MNKVYSSPVIVGCMKLGKWGANFSTSELEQFIDQCLDLGLNEFDHADIYGAHTTEAEFGEVMKHRPDLKSKVKITTKCGIAYPSDLRDHKIKHYDSSPGYIRGAVEQALINLSLDEIDIFLIHRPDWLMDPSEIASVFEEIKKEGKVKQFGVSNFTPSQFDVLSGHTELVTNQVEISINHRDPFEDGTLDQLLAKGIQPTAWSPLAGGEIFTSKDDQPSRIRKCAEAIGEKYDLKIDQVLLAWLNTHPAVIVPVLGTSKIDRFTDAIEAMKTKLTREEWYELWTAATGEKVA